MDINPALQGNLLLITQLELIGSTSVAGTLYGIAFALYWLYVHSSFPKLRSHDRKRQTVVMISFTTAGMLFGLINLAMNVWIIQDAFIKHYNFSGGPVAYESTILRIQSLICHVCNWLIILIFDAIQVWRLWAIWSATQYGKLVVILPLLCLVASLPLEIRAMVIDITFILPGSEDQGLKIGIAEFALHATISVYCTTLIAGYLTSKYRRHRNMIWMNQLSTPYMHIVEMLVESYAMESACIIVTAILWALSNPLYQFFANVETYIEIIACVLVLYRVAHGTAYQSQQESNNVKISALRWDRPVTSRNNSMESDENPHASKAEVGEGTLSHSMSV